MEEDRTESFNPPLWRQRRTFIRDVLREHAVSSVLDYGCGEASVLSFLILSSDDPVPITKLAGIDICPEVLKEAIEACRPWEDDYTDLRLQPLEIDLYQGSVDQFDKRLLGYDALVCSEVIEHLYQPTLDKFLDITLGHYGPPLMVVTTPNCEYNINFEALQYGTPNAVFRHDDHKFEWTRQEFETWCRAGATQYGYDVTFHGIGLIEGKQNDVSVGHCTQACVFTRHCSKDDNNSIIIKQQQRREQHAAMPHQLVKHIEFPYYAEPPLSDEEALVEIERFIAVLCQAEQEEVTSQEKRQRKEQPAHQLETDLHDGIDWQNVDWSSSTLMENLAATTTTTTADLIDTLGSSASSETSFNSSTCSLGDNMYYYHGDEIQQKLYTRVPQRFPYSILWDILRVRQVCKEKQRMIEILKNCSKHYQIDGQDLVVLKPFEVTPPYDDYTNHEDDHDDDSDDNDFSSNNDDDFKDDDDLYT